MTVEEYRLKHKKCRYCKYSSASIFSICYCNPKEKHINYNAARRCPLYIPETLKRGDKE